MSFTSQEKQIHYLQHDICVLMSILMDHLYITFEPTEHVDRYFYLCEFLDGEIFGGRSQMMSVKKLIFLHPRETRWHKGA